MIVVKLFRMKLDYKYFYIILEYYKLKYLKKFKIRKFNRKKHK